MIAEINHWQNLLFSFLLYGLILFAIFKLLPFVLKLIKPKKKIHHYLTWLIPIVELGFWIFFLSWYSFLFATEGQLFGFLITGLLAFIVFLLSWYYLRDVIAGIVIHAQRKLKVGDILQSTTVAGQIVRFSVTDIQLITKDDAIYYVPYSWLLKNGVFQKVESQSLSSSTNIVLTIKSSINQNELEQSMRKFCLALPWVDFTRPLKVNVLHTSHDEIQVELRLHLFNSQTKGRVEEALLAEFNQ